MRLETLRRDGTVIAKSEVSKRPGLGGRAMLPLHFSLPSLQRVCACCKISRCAKNILTPPAHARVVHRNAACIMTGQLRWPLCPSSCIEDRVFHFHLSRLPPPPPLSKSCKPGAGRLATGNQLIMESGASSRGAAVSLHPESPSAQRKANRWGRREASAGKGRRAVAAIDSALWHLYYTTTTRLCLLRGG